MASSSSALPNPFQKQDEEKYQELIDALNSYMTSLTNKTKQYEGDDGCAIASKHIGEITDLVRKMETYKKKYDEEKVTFSKIKTTEISFEEKEFRINEAEGAVSMLMSLNLEGSNLLKQINIFIAKWDTAMQTKLEAEAKKKHDEFLKLKAKEEKKESKKVSKRSGTEEGSDFFIQYKKFMEASDAPENMEAFLNEFEKLIRLLPPRAKHYSTLQIDAFARRTDLEDEEKEIVQFQEAASRVFAHYQKVCEHESRRAFTPFFAPNPPGRRVDLRGGGLPSVPPQLPHTDRIIGLVTTLADAEYAPAMITQLHRSVRSVHLQRSNLKRYIQRHGMQALFATGTERLKTACTSYRDWGNDPWKNPEREDPWMERISAYLEMFEAKTTKKTKPSFYYSFARPESLRNSKLVQSMQVNPEMYANIILNGIAFLPLFCQYYSLDPRKIALVAESLTPHGVSSASSNSSSTPFTSAESKEIKAIPDLEAFLGFIPLFRELAEQNPEEVVNFFREFSEEDIRVMMQFLSPGLQEKIAELMRYDRTGFYRDVMPYRAGPEMLPDLWNTVGLFINPREQISEIAAGRNVQILKDKFEKFGSEIIKQCNDFERSHELETEDKELLKRIRKAAEDFIRNPTVEVGRILKTQINGLRSEVTEELRIALEPTVTEVMDIARNLQLVDNARNLPRSGPKGF